MIGMLKVSRQVRPLLECMDVKHVRLLLFGKVQSPLLRGLHEVDVVNGSRVIEVIIDDRVKD